MLIPYPDSDNVPKIDLDSIPLELRLSPMTILEPATSNEKMEYFAQSYAEVPTTRRSTELTIAELSEHNKDSPKVHSNYGMSKINSMDKEYLMKNIKNAISSKKSGDEKKGGASGTAHHDDRVTRIY